jgi:hypothetical protein
MALCRCKLHKPTGRKHNYDSFREPFGYPNSSSICGYPECNSVGLIWLTDVEANANLNIVSFPTNSSKVRLQ